MADIPFHTHKEGACH